ncbi:hypothetical protein DPMN_182238 [Dreissena polymorpha]|uniref:Uncharacterized protein n=1 Tax=Dreissena polymorpha TaxID=45954 RepID=A0A9D4I2E4_DREPO|nr:hypothetical protein DPMN_182238 [Dreissena polymorpha]
MQAIDKTCKLFGRPANLEHILSSCKTALTSGRYRWRHDKICKLFGRQANLEHILSSCKTALTSGRYRWRHDKILIKIAASIFSSPDCSGELL